MALVEDALATLWNSVVNGVVVAIPAILVLIIGYIVGKILGRVTREILVRANVDKYVSREEHISIEVSSIASLIVRWLVYLTFIVQAARMATLFDIANAVQTVAFFVSQVVMAAATIIVGYLLALYIKDRIITSKTMHSDITGKIVFGLIIYLSIVLGLGFIEKVVGTTVITNLVLVITGAVGVGIAIALGLGLKDVVAEAAKQYMKEGKGRGRKK